MTTTEFESLERRLERMETLLAGVADRAAVPALPMILNTKELAEFTGWSVSHIQKMCQAGRLPHIKSRPLMFLRSSIMDTLQGLQVGGGYGRRKPRKMKGKA